MIGCGVNGAVAHVGCKFARVTMCIEKPMTKVKTVALALLVIALSGAIVGVLILTLRAARDIQEAAAELKKTAFVWPSDKQLLTM